MDVVAAHPVSITGRPHRLRRSCLAVPGSSPRMLEKARALPADEVFLDLEDSVVPALKVEARANVVSALNEKGWHATTLAIRVNDLTTSWTHRDIIAVVEGAGDSLDSIIVPKVESARHLWWADMLLTQLERANGLPVGRIAIEAQIESTAGLVAVDRVAAATPRLEAILFGPLDFIGSVGMRASNPGEQPDGYDVGDAYHHPLMRILTAAGSCGLQAIDGPELRVRDIQALQRSAARSVALGFDGKMVLHPDQIVTVNTAFSQP